MPRPKFLLMSVPVLLALVASVRFAHRGTSAPTSLATAPLPDAALPSASTPEVEQGAPSAVAAAPRVRPSQGTPIRTNEAGTPIEPGGVVPAPPPTEGTAEEPDSAPGLDPDIDAGPAPGPRVQPVQPVQLAWVSVAAAVEVTVARPAGGASPDPATLYDLRLEATPKVAKGAEGTVSVRIAPHKGAHLSDEAPVTLTLSAPPSLELSKTKATKADVKYANGGGSLEVPFKAVEPGKASIEAKLRFYICTDSTCAQQEKAASLPVTVR